jgi:hypothetical protein
VNRAYRITIVCGALPLLLGAGIFLAWLALEREWLMVAGIHTIYLGFGLFVVGLGSLGCYWWRASRAPEVPRDRMWSNIAGALVLLLANFPAAFGIVGAAVAVATRYRVVVHNRSAQPLNEIRLWGGGASAAIFSIAPQDTAERSLWFKGDGELKFEAKVGAKTLTTPVEGNVTNGGGGRAEVVVHEDGKVVVTHPGKR